jgi:hypothetical protein
MELDEKLTPNTYTTAREWNAMCVHIRTLRISGSDRVWGPTPAHSCVDTETGPKVCILGESTWDTKWVHLKDITHVWVEWFDWSEARRNQMRRQDCSPRHPSTETPARDASWPMQLDYDYDDSLMYGDDGDPAYGNWGSK